MRYKNRFKNHIEGLILFCIDVVSIIVIFQLSIIIRTDVLPFIYADFPQQLPFKNFINIWWIFLVWIFFFCYEGLYGKRFLFWDEIKALWKSAFFSTTSIFVIVSIGKLSDEISRTVIILMGILAIPILPLIKINSKRVLRRSGFLKKRVLILGAGETGRLIARALKREPNYGYKVIGFLDDDLKKVGKRIDGVKVHQYVDNAFRYIRRCNIRDVFIAMPSAKKERLQYLINELQHKVERVFFVPDMFGMAVLGTTLHHFFQEQAFVLEIQNNLEKPLNLVIKRCFDLFVSGLLAIFLFIPMVILSILIKCNSNGPAIFSHYRIGRNGKRFKCYKFRTMYNDAKERLKNILNNDEDVKKEWETCWKLRNDPRVTKIGEFLRKTSLDELPQIFNVLKGEMSLVGPRPVIQNEIDKYYKDMAELCFCVPPGITGLWQVSGRSTTNYDYRIALDSWYVRNWNLWLDIVILFKTVKVVINKEGAV